MKKVTPKASKWYGILRLSVCFALICAIAFGKVVSLGVAKAADSSTASFTTANGFVEIEAENTTWNISLMEEYTIEGEKAIRYLGLSTDPAGKTGVKEIAAPTTGEMPGIQFEVTADQAGTYYVWARVYSYNNNRNAAWMSINQGDYITVTVGKSGTYQKLAWQKLNADGYVVQNDGDKFVVSIHPKEVGKSYNVQYDKFVITTNPDAAGPFEIPEETTTEAPEETTTQAPEETTTQAPEETTTQAPEETTTQAPEETTTEAPEETTTQAPEETTTEAPEETTTQAPEETTTEAPEETTTQAPEETTTQTPEETTTEAPEETTTQAPEETTTQAPEETTTQAPEETTTEAPEETTTQTPEETTTEAPEETTTQAPEETTTEAPEETTTQPPEETTTEAPEETTTKAPEETTTQTPEETTTQPPEETTTQAPEETTTEAPEETTTQAPEETTTQAPEETTTQAPDSTSVQIIPAGTVGNYTSFSGNAVTIHADGNKADLIGVAMNGQMVDSENYVVTEGSTIVTFKNSYLDTLTAGTYKVTLLYKAGQSAECSLVIAKGEKPSDETSGTNAVPGGDPDTGDLNGASNWLWLFMIAMVVMTGCATVGVEKKKQK